MPRCASPRAPASGSRMFAGIDRRAYPPKMVLGPDRRAVERAILAASGLTASESAVDHSDDGDAELGASAELECGRPYLVDGIPRTASAIMRDDWSAVIVRGDLELDEHARAVVAAHWQRCALTEHASVAAFARYALDLLALAAPAELVAGAAAAMTDEIEHARLCFALAARYGARACGPGPLPSDDALRDRTPLRILDDVVREACIGETLAALEAIEALAQAREPAVRAALQRIADDELRHAQLGWRHLRWALERAHGDEREAMIDVVEAAFADAMRAPIIGAAEPTLRAHGVLDAESRARARHGGLLEVVRPCATALIGATAGPPSFAVA
jgi:hypothetical protein